MSAPKKAACIGGGVIGGGWVARLALNGVDVTVCDPDADAGRKIAAMVDNARRAWSRLTEIPLPAMGAIGFAGTIQEAAADADLIVESVPERLDLKREVYRQAEEAAAEDALIASSTSGILPTELQAEMAHPERLAVAHPFNPVYLLPCVELVAGEKTSPETIDRAEALYLGLGMKPVRVRKEIEAFIADRLLEALWRESLWLIHDGIATTQDIDDVIRYGFGLRFAQMGIFETYRLGGGEAGMRHFLAQFGPCLKWPWTKLTDVPELTDELIETIAGQSDAQSGAHSTGELERIRDDNLVAIIGALRGKGWGAGESLADFERRIAQGTERVPAAGDERAVSDLVTCRSVGVYSDQLTRGKVYAVLDRDDRGQVTIRTDLDRTRKFPGDHFLPGRQDLPRLESIRIDDPIEDADRRAIEVTVLLSDGQARWCSFITPAQLANYGDYISDTDDRFHCSSHTIVATRIDEETVKWILHELDAQDQLIAHTLPLE
jgi:carnitine 3-dehydrogenase